MCEQVNFLILTLIGKFSILCTCRPFGIFNISAFAKLAG